MPFDIEKDLILPGWECPRAPHDERHIGYLCHRCHLTNDFYPVHCIKRGCKRNRCTMAILSERDLPYWFPKLDHIWGRALVLPVERTVWPLD